MQEKVTQKTIALVIKNAKLVGEGAGVSFIEVTEENIKSFECV